MAKKWHVDRWVLPESLPRTLERLEKNGYICLDCGHRFKHPYILSIPEHHGPPAEFDACPKCHSTGIWREKLPTKPIENDDRFDRMIAEKESRKEAWE